MENCITERAIELRQVKECLDEEITECKRAVELMKASLKEKELLLREMHHRIKNNLGIVNALLALQARYTDDEAHRLLFHELQNRVRCMAIAHERLYKTEKQSNLSACEYMASLVDHLVKSSSFIGSSIELKKEVEDASFTLDTAISLGFLVTELVSNCVKHAFPRGRTGLITLDLRSTEPSTFQLSVKDNGIGIPGDIDLTNPTSLGWELIDTFVERLQGKMEIIRHKGTEVRVIFKDPPD